MTTLITTRYELTEKTETTEAGAITQYGIAAFDEKGDELLHIDSITCDRKSLSELIECCNNGNLSSLHIKDVVCDYVDGK